MATLLYTTLFEQTASAIAMSPTSQGYTDIREKVRAEWTARVRPTATSFTTSAKTTS